MHYIEFNPAFESIFAQNGLRTFEDFIHWDEGQMINRNEKRDVTILRFATSDGPRVFFMKRFFSPHLKDMVFTFRNFGRLCSQAELEWRSSSILLENGIETYRPACWGAQTCCGIERRSFFVTEKINGRSLIEFLLENWSGFASHQQEKLIIGMARFFRKLHTARLSLPDSYLWHLFILEPIDPQQPYRFAIIDLHRMRINAAAWHHAARNLGALLFSLPEEWFDTKLRELFLNTYLEPVEGKTITNQKAFLDTLKKREKILIARRKKPSIDRLKKMA
jgi:hypothetical protein